MRTDHLCAMMNAIPEWRARVWLNTLLDDDGEIEALMVRSGEVVSTTYAYGLSRTLPRRD